MTQNQISNAKLQEDIRHNKVSEKLGRAQNKYNREHFERSDQTTKEHYERADTASLISANASAINAQAATTNAATNRLNYQLTYDIEHAADGLPVDERTMYLHDSNGNKSYKWVYPEGKPASGVQKVLQAYGLAAEDISKLEEASNAKEYYKSRSESENANALNRYAGAASSVLNSTFGKGGIVAGLDRMFNR